MSSVRESSGVQVDNTLERPSTTNGQTDVDHSSDEHETQRQEQLRHPDPTSDATAARWIDKAASTSMEHQPHDSTLDEQGGTSTTDGEKNVDCCNVDCDTSRQ